MKKAHCIDCGQDAEVLHCNSCSNRIPVCSEHREIYFMVDTPSEFVCVDCTNAGVGGLCPVITPAKQGGEK